MKTIATLLAKFITLAYLSVADLFRKEPKYDDSEKFWHD
jgi:hypothetical protein